MHIEIIAKDNNTPGSWFNDKIGQIFEVIETDTTAIQPVYHVKYNHPGGTKIAFVPFRCAKLAEVE